MRSSVACLTSEVAADSFEREGGGTGRRDTAGRRSVSPGRETRRFSREAEQERERQEELDTIHGIFIPRINTPSRNTPN